MTPFFCIGHRGAAGLEPENTLRSIRRALELGVNGIEIDIHLSRDGEPVVIHDATLRRTTGAAGKVGNFTLAELRELNAGHGERIPTLREVLDLLDGRVLLNIELKGQGTAAVVAREAALALEGGRWTPGRLLVSSFDRRELAVAAAAEPRLPVGLLISRRPLRLAALAERFRAVSLHVPLRLAGVRLLARARALGLRVFVFTVNSPRTAARLRSLGVDGVFTDFPDRIPPREDSFGQIS